MSETDPSSDPDREALIEQSAALYKMAWQSTDGLPTLEQVTSPGAVFRDTRRGSLVFVVDREVVAVWTGLCKPRLRSGPPTERTACGLLIAPGAFLVEPLPVEVRLVAATHLVACGTKPEIYLARGELEEIAPLVVDAAYVANEDSGETPEA